MSRKRSWLFYMHSVVNWMLCLMELIWLWIVNSWLDMRCHWCIIFKIWAGLRVHDCHQDITSRHNKTTPRTRTSEGHICSTSHMEPYKIHQQNSDSLPNLYMFQTCNDPSQLLVHPRDLILPNIKKGVVPYGRKFCIPNPITMLITTWQMWDKQDRH